MGDCGGCWRYRGEVGYFWRVGGVMDGRSWADGMREVCCQSDNFFYKIIFVNKDLDGLKMIYSVNAIVLDGGCWLCSQSVIV